MPQTDAILDLRGVHLRYQKVHAVRGVDMVVRSGRLTTIIGSNGAGKTTILKAVTGLLKPSEGHILFCGEDIAGREPDDIVHRGISLVPEGRRLFGPLTVRENLNIGAYLRTDRAAVVRDFDKVMAYFPDLVAKLDDRAESLSGGQQQMVAVGRALMAAPRLLMLDEPTIGLAPNLVRTIGKIIKTISDNGTDVLLVEQNASIALALSSEAYVLENGMIAMQGPSAELAASENVKRAYLGN
ncbi:ABC transporter ATP-binding protein [Rhodoligotrophos ferricapiens]|uniref:ABC transporter ATP-binding protein n=1 Tax=Rhodoligotrophos ferricapiens TaxID=3069264 RepID=UPI00315CEC78